MKKKKDKDKNKGKKKENTNFTIQQERQHFYNSNSKYEHLLPGWRCYQAIVLNDQQVRSISLAPLLPYLNDAPQQCKQCVNTKKVAAGLKHKIKKVLKIEKWTNILPYATYLSNEI